MGSQAEAVATREVGWGSRSERLVSGYVARITDPRDRARGLQIKIPPRDPFSDPRTFSEPTRVQAGAPPEPSGTHWGAGRRGSGRLSTLRLAPAWPGSPGRRSFPAPSCPPSH